MNLNLFGKYSEIYVNGESFKLKDIEKAKDDFMQLILDVFKEENDNSY